jgi:hypothetical protein
MDGGGYDARDPRYGTDTHRVICDWATLVPASTTLASFQCSSALW